MEQQGYLNKRYDKKWKLLGRPAVYSLSAKGICYIRKEDYGFSEQVYKNQYKNRSASLQLVDSSLDLAGLCLRLSQKYGPDLDIFSKSEITRFEDFLRPLPDLYLRRKNKAKEKEYVLEVIEAGTLTWVIRKRIYAHQEWYDENAEDGWVFNEYPTLLLLCDNSNTEKRIHKLTDDVVGDFDVLTTTRKRFNSPGTGIWLHYWDEDMEMQPLYGIKPGSVSS